MKPFFSAPTPLAIAHRGSQLLWPENTLVGFKEAADLGYQCIETDLWATSDGVLVAFHDATLERTTNGSGAVERREWAELAELDAAYGFGPDEGHPYRGQGIGIPRLDELFETFPDMRWVLELKQSGIEGLLADFLAHHNAEERVIVGSFGGRRLSRFRRLTRGRVATSAGPLEVTALYAASRAGRPLRTAADAVQVPDDLGFARLVDARFVEALHAAGKHIHVWTVNDPIYMEALLDTGVDGIITDRPDALKALLTQRGQWHGGPGHTG